MEEKIEKLNTDKSKPSTPCNDPVTRPLGQPVKKSATVPVCVFHKNIPLKEPTK